MRKLLAMTQILMILLLGVSVSSCSSKALSRKSPDRARGERFYRLKVGSPDIIYHRTCNEGRKDEVRECTEVEEVLTKKWDFYSPEFILIPYKYVFP